MKKTFISRTGHAIAAHKIWTTIIVIALAAGGYGAYRTITTTAAVPQYTLSVARLGTITQTVTGSGQVSASNQTDILGQVSGTIQSVNVSVGQTVKAGALIATIDPTNALVDLQNSKISLAKLTEPAKEADVTTATNNLSKAYNDAFDATANAYLDLPNIMAGMRDLLYSRTGFLTDQNSSYLISTAREYRNNTAKLYDAAVIQYQKTLTEFNGITRTSPSSSIRAVLSDTIETMKAVSRAVTSAQTTITFVTSAQTEYNSSTAASAAASINSWSTTSNGDLSSLISAQNSIQTSGSSLATLQAGADALDVQSAQIALQQKEKAYSDYFIRAPYDGIIGRIPVSVYGQAGASTVIATIVGEKKIASISLNEVDAAKIEVGQRVTITFDAIDGLSATGTVSQVDQIGAVSSGVVSYGVKIAINTSDARIRPGMSVNTTIITKEKPNVLVVPSTAVKTQGATKYVQVFDQSAVAAQMSAANSGRIAPSSRLAASTTRQFNGQFRNASTTQSSTNPSGAERTITISSAIPPQQMTVEAGDSDDTNTEIVSGLTAGQFVVTKTTATSAATAAAAPSILNSLGGNRTGAAGGNRTFVRPANGG